MGQKRALFPASEEGLAEVEASRLLSLISSDTLVIKLDEALMSLHVISKDLCPQISKSCERLSVIRNTIIEVRNVLKKNNLRKK